MKKHCKSAFKAAPILLVLGYANPAVALPRLTMSFQGAWDAALSSQKGYQKGDVVSYNNALYQSLLGKNKITPGPTVTSYWRKVLEASSGSSGSGATPDCENPGVAANLVGCQYPTGIQLRNKDLRGSQLISATLAGDLGVVNLDGANLVGAKLGVAGEGDGMALTLVGGASGGYASRLRGANLASSETPYGFPLQALAVDFRDANLTDINWNGANLEGAFMAHSILLHGNLMNCIASAVDLSYADLRSAILWNAKLDGAILFEANLSRAQLSGVDLRNADLTNASLTDALLTVADDGPTNLSGANLSGANLSGADFTEATGGASVVYTAATKFDGATCPDGTKVNGTSVINCQSHGFGAPL